MSETTNLFLVIEARTAEFQNKIRSATQRVQEMGRKMSTVGRQMSLKVTAPIVAVGTAAFRSSMQFEEAMSKIVGLVGVSQDQVDQWSKELLKLGPALGKTPQELADGLFFVTSAGFRGAEALEVLEISAKASAAGLGETKTVADLVTSAINAYGVENLNASQATDILVAAVREGKAEAPELAAALGSVLPIASELGMTFDQVAATTAAMTRTGTDAATANTQLRGILTTLLKPSKQAEEALDEYGLSASGLRKQLEGEGLLSVLHTLRERFGENEEALAKVFPNVRALAGVLDLVGENAEANIKTFEEVANATGSLEHAFQTAEATARQKWNKVLAQLSSSSISLGEAVRDTVVPMMERFTQVIEKVTDWFTSLDEKQRQNIVRWGLIIAAIGPVLVILGTLISSVGTVMGVFVGLGGKIVGLGAKAGLLATGGIPAITGAATTMGAKLTALAAATGPILGVGLALVGLGIMVKGIVDNIKLSMRTKEDVINESMGRIEQTYETTYSNLLATQIEANIAQAEETINHLENIEELTDEQHEKLLASRKELYNLQQAEQRANNLAQHKLMEQLGDDLADAADKGQKEVKTVIEDAWLEKEKLVGEQHNQERHELERQYVELGNITFSEWKKQDAALREHHRGLVEEVRDNFGVEMVQEYGDMLVNAGFYWDKEMGEIRRIQTNHLGQIMTDIEKHHGPGIVKAYEDVASDAQGAFSIDLRPSGESMMDTFETGLRSRRGSILTTVSNFASDVRRYFPFSPAKEGPLKKTPDWASYLTHGLDNAKNVLTREMGATLSIQPTGSGAMTIRHEVDLVNVPPSVDQGSLEARLESMLNNPSIKRKLDQIGHENSERYRGLGG